MTKLTPKSRTKHPPVVPSTRDAISSWLDVLTSMLVVSESQRLQIRDELEDHLRSRVDDLLIVGKSEPRAIQIAVAELGETAELAKLITHAHTRINPRRKIMNAALIAVALGGMSFGGFTLITGTGAPSAPPGGGGAVPVVVPGDRDREVAHESETGRASNDLLATVATVPVNQDVSYFELLKPFAEKLGLTLEIDRVAFHQRGLTPTMTIRLVNNPERTLGQVLDSIPNAIDTSLWRKYGEDDEIVAQQIDDALFVSTRRGLDRRTTHRVVYGLGDLANPDPDLPVLANSSSSVLIVRNIGSAIIEQIRPSAWSDLGGNLAAMNELGTNLVITAPDSMHAEIEILLADIRERVAKQTEIVQEQKRALVEEQRMQQVQRKQAIERIRAEYIRVRDEYIALGNQVGAASAKRYRLEVELQSQDMNSDEAEKIEDQIQALSTKRFELELRRDEYQQRYDYLRQLLIESQYAELFEVFTLPDVHSQESSTEVPTVAVRGFGVKAGLYEYVPRMKISRLLTIATTGRDIDPDRFVTIQRDGAVMRLGSIRDIVGGHVDVGSLMVGDTLVIADSDH